MSEHKELEGRVMNTGGMGMFNTGYSKMETSTYWMSSKQSQTVSPPPGNMSISGMKGW